MTNRTARRLLGVDINNTYRISNRSWLVWSANYPHLWTHSKPSRRQKRANIRHLAIRAAIRERNEQGGATMLNKLLSMFVRTKWPCSNQHDYTKQMWGHALHGMDKFKEKGKFKITGHNMNRGLIFANQLKAGDTLKIGFTNGRVGILRVWKLSFFSHPYDMFAATVSFEGLIEGGDHA